MEKFTSTSLLTPQAGSQEDFFFKNNIVKPPENVDAVNRVTERTILIDSTFRDRKEYPEPNKYTVELPNEYKDVISLQIINYSVPSTQYNVRTTNNLFYYSETDPIIRKIHDQRYEISYSKVNMKKITLPDGYYPVDLAPDDQTPPNYRDMLASELESYFNDTTTSDCTVTIDPKKDRYTITTNFANSNSNRNAGMASLEPTETSFFYFFPLGPLEYNGTSEVVSKTTNKILNVKNTPPANYSVANLMGYYREDIDNTLKGIITMDSSGTITGVGTSFTKQLQTGDWIYVRTIDNLNSYRYQIDVITSDTECTVNSGSTDIVSFGNAFAWVGRIEAPGVRNLLKDNYIVLKIEGSGILDSTVEKVNSSFCIIPTYQSRFEILDNLTTTKKYNPVLGRMQKLSISFHNPDGSLYDFQGIDHVLVFKLTRYVQNISFANF